MHPTTQTSATQNLATQTSATQTSAKGSQIPEPAAAEPPLFETVERALVFAYNYTAQWPQNTLARLQRDLQGRRSSDKGLAGLDGAAQAAMIQVEIGRLAENHRHILRLRFGVCEDLCPHCLTMQPCREWTEALGVLAGRPELKRLTDPLLRRYIVAQLVRRQSVSAEAIARRAGRAPRTLREHIGLVRKALEALELDAINAAEARFRLAGLVA